MNILVAYDGSLHAKRALAYGLAKGRETGATLTLLQVFDPSVFIDYGAGPQAEETARHEAAQYLMEARQIIGEQGKDLNVRIIAEDGDPVQRIVHHALSLSAGLILCPPRYKAVVRAAPCPVSVIPGTILVPVDSAETTPAHIDRIVREASATDSSLVLLGIVPVHLYSREEEREVETVKKETAAEMTRLKQVLAGKGIEAKELLSEGYPDEEILKAADELSVSQIILPASGKTPSELSKAAAMLIDGPQKMQWPVLLLPAETAA